MHVLTEIKNCGAADVCMVVCDGLKGLPEAIEAIEAVWPRAVTQTRVVHLALSRAQASGRLGGGKAVEGYGGCGGLHGSHDARRGAVPASTDAP
jgi:hypothetical protein